MSIGPTCPRCNTVHPSNAARAVSLFAHTPQGYRSALGGPLRDSRAEAEADWCESAASWHVDHDTLEIPEQPERITPPAVEPTEPQPFPAAEMETLARAKAWADFLSHVRFSLSVWELDPQVRTGCEDVRAWIERCRADLVFGEAS